jgi:hypothetical protein
MVCDWSRAEHPGIGPAWALLLRLADLGAAPLVISHTGDPPHFLELLQKAPIGRAPDRGNRCAPRRAAKGPSANSGAGPCCKALEARAVIGFFGRIVTVSGRDFFAAARAAPVVAGAAYL